MSPHHKHNTLMIALTMTTDLNRLHTLIAPKAGTTIKLEISSAPIILIPTTMTRDVRIAIKRLNTFIFFHMFFHDCTTINHDFFMIINFSWSFFNNKKSTVGDCNTEKPGMLDFKGKAKWEAWNAVKGKDKEVAKREYVELVLSLLPENIKKEYN